MMDRIDSPRLICVEGKDEINFFNALLKYLSIDNVQIIDFEGKDKFKNKIPALVNMQGFDTVETIALIRDADENPPVSAFESLVSILRNSGLKPPTSNQSFSNGKPKIGIFILPGNSQTGALEDLCLNSIYSTDHFKCIEQYFNCLNANLNHLSKAKVLCYLAGKEPFSNALGIAAQKGHWDFSNHSFDPLKEFVMQLR
ncbi:MAG: DUF3226 domain-containing protein [Bacteroidales bacterium]